MWRFLAKIFLLFFLLSLQSVLLKYMSMDFLKPDLAIPFVAYEAFFFSSKSALLMAFLAGLIQEGFSLVPPCTLLLTKMAILITLFFLRGSYYIESSYIFGLTCGFMDVFQTVFLILISLLAKGESKGLLNILFYTLPNFTFTSLVSIGIYNLLTRIDGSFRERGWI